MQLTSPCELNRGHQPARDSLDISEEAFSVGCANHRGGEMTVACSLLVIPEWAAKHTHPRHVSAHAQRLGLLGNGNEYACGGAPCGKTAATEVMKKRGFKRTPNRAQSTPGLRGAASTTATLANDSACLCVVIACEAACLLLFRFLHANRAVLLK
eukprot:4077185-Amphidinium_carterae.1